MKSRFQYQKVAPVSARTGSNGQVFHSKTEKDRYEYLRLLQMGKQIRNLKTQVEFSLSNPCGIRVMAGQKVARYTPDFCYEEKIDGEWFDVIEDVKGYPDESSKLRIRVFEALYGVKVKIVKKEKGRGWVEC